MQVKTYKEKNNGHNPYLENVGAAHMWKCKKENTHDNKDVIKKEEEAEKPSENIKRF